MVDLIEKVVGSLSPASRQVSGTQRGPGAGRADPTGRPEFYNAPKPTPRAAVPDTVRPVQQDDDDD